jgi:hypothetical protein
MLEIKRVNSRVHLDIQTGVLDKYYTLDLNCSNDLHAELLRRAFDAKLEKELQRIRRNAYNQGWKDAKSKKVPKATWFSKWWED